MMWDMGRKRGQSAMQVALRQQPVKLAKGQSAMEFLMTYGWAILVVLIVISVLFLLGVFSPQSSNSCQVPPGFSCYTFKVADGGKLSFDLGHAKSSNILIDEMACDANETPRNWTDINVKISIGMHVMIDNVTCYNEDGTRPSLNERYAGKVFINYNEVGTNISHRITGDIIYLVMEMPE